MSNNKIVVIMINYNGIEDSIAAIKSVQASSVEVDIILVDNDSKNNEASVLSKMFPKVTVIGSEKNCGFSGGNNLGINFALERGYDYILLLNNDTVVDANMIEMLAKHANSSTVTVPKMYYFDKPNTIWYGGGEINFRTGRVTHTHINEPDTIENCNKACTFATGCCMLIHRNIFADVGLLDESYFMYSEDLEFCVRLFEKQKKVLYVPDAKLWHKVSSSTGGTESPFSIYYMARNSLHCIKNNKRIFKQTAYYCSVAKLCIKLLLKLICGNEAWKAYKCAFRDHKQGVRGEVLLK